MSVGRITQLTTTQLDLPLAIRHRNDGIRKVAAKNATFINTMRGVARLLCRQKGTITADNLREWMAQHPEVGPPTHYNAWGALFGSAEWKREFEFVGFVKSRQAQGNGNIIREWRLRSA